MSNLEKTIAKAFLEMAEGLENGTYGARPKIALTGMGSEHGEENAMAAAVMASKRGVDVYYIGSLEAEGVTTIHVENEDEGHKKMEEMVEKTFEGSLPAFVAAFASHAKLKEEDAKKLMQMIDGFEGEKE